LLRTVASLVSSSGCATPRDDPEGRERAAKRAGTDWIPAFAGMTIGEGCEDPPVLAVQRGSE